MVKGLELPHGAITKVDNTIKVAEAALQNIGHVWKQGKHYFRWLSWIKTIENNKIHSDKILVIQTGQLNLIHWRTHMALGLTLESLTVISGLFKKGLFKIDIATYNYYWLINKDSASHTNSQPHSSWRDTMQLHAVFSY